MSNTWNLEPDKGRHSINALLMLFRPSIRTLYFTFCISAGKYRCLNVTGAWRDLLLMYLFIFTITVKNDKYHYTYSNFLPQKV